MRMWTPRACRTVLAVWALALAVGCASSRPASGPAAAKTAPPRCVRGTLGIEAGPLSRKLRSELALPAGVSGAVVVEVLPGGPGAAAGILRNDIVQAIGDTRISNDCAFDDVAHGRTCDPVRVVVRRGGAPIEVTLVPVDQDALFERACRAGATGGCFLQAWSLWARGPEERERALTMYEAACRAGSAEACAFEGLHLAERADRGTDAVQALERSCELESAAGCAHLGFLYAVGKIVKRDDHRATPLYVKSCDLGDAQGCYNAGLMSEDGRGVAKDLARAAARYAEGCENGSSTACTNLGFLYERGNGVKRDEARAAALYEKGCAGSSCQPANLAGCVNLGRAFRDGMGVGKDPARAAPIFEEACHRKIAPEDVHAEGNRARACSLLGALYLSGDGVEKDPSRARELSEAGCGQGDSFGCFNAAVIYGSGVGVPPDPKQATEFFERACRVEDGEGCYEASKAYEKGSGVPRDLRRAAELKKKACDLGFEKACAKKPGRVR